jgi:hypothetical protein
MRCSSSTLRTLCREKCAFPTSLGMTLMPAIYLFAELMKERWRLRVSTATQPKLENVAARVVGIRPLRFKQRSSKSENGNEIRFEYVTKRP